MNETTLQTLKNKKALYAGIGNLLRRDDGVGVYITSHLTHTNHVCPLCVEVSIENYIGRINQTYADVLVLIDSMDFKEPPGYWNLLPIEQVNGITTNTHNISLDKVSELFNKQTYILGIQPGDLNFGEELTAEVKKSADNIIYQIQRL